MTNFVMNWFEKRNPLMLVSYDWRFQGEEYDKAMRHYGDVYHSHESALHPDVSAAHDRVVDIRERITKQRIREFQKRRALHYSC